MPSNAIIEVANLNLNGRLAIERLSLLNGQFVHVLGANGAGKSTLIAALAGLQADALPLVEFKQRTLSDWSIASLAQHRSLLTQQVLSQFEVSVTDTLSYFSGDRDVPEKLELALDISELLERQLNLLSGGEQQRVHIARCLMQVWPAIETGAALILMDEPCQGLDVRHQLSLMQLLTDLAQHGNTVLVTSHDVNLAARYASHCLLLKQGYPLAFGDSQSVITLENLKVCYECDFHLIYSENAYDFFFPRVN